MMAAMETFVVRIFVPIVDGETLPLCGIVEHVGSGGSKSFHGGDDLVELMRRVLAGPTQAVPTAADDEAASDRQDR